MNKLKKLAVWASVLMITTIAFFVVISPRASAGTPVGGYIDSDTFWTLLGSPYWVEGDVIVRNGANLTIEVGVDVLFNGYYSIYLEEGAVLWIDAFINPPYALFSSNFSTKYVGAWRGIQFNESDYDYLSITDSVIEYATYGVRLERASLTVRNSTIRNCGYGIHSNYGFPTIENNTIESCTVDGIYVIDEQPSSLSVNIKNNKIHNNTQHGIILNYVTYARIRNNTIENCTYGIYGRYSSSCIENNTVKNCTGDGIYILDDETSLTSTDIKNNNVSNNGNGINLYSSSNNSITTNKISNNNKGIYLRYSSGNIITSNNISNNDYGIYSDHSAPQIGNNTIAYNTEDGAHITGNCPGGGYPNLENNTVYSNIKRGIVLYDVQNTRLRNNNISNNNYNFGVWADTLSEFDHDIDTTNTVNQKPIYYWRNHEHDDESIPSDAGYVGIVNSTNIVTENLTLTHNGQGVLVAYSNYTIINNVTATDHELGVILFSSPNNTIESCNISNNDHNGYYQGASGIYLRSSIDNTITNNTVSWNILNGTYLFSSDNNELSNNTLVSNNIGISIVLGSYNIVQNNTLNSNQKVGIYLSGSNTNYNDVNNNTVSNSDYGIFVSADCNNISYNLVLNCKGNWGYGIYLGHVLVWANVVNNNNASNNNYGITIRGSSYNTIKNNIANSNTYHGIYVHYDPVSHINSHHNVILNNFAIGNGVYGIYLEGDSMDEGYNTVSNNTVKSNNAGIVLSQILYNNITLNDVNSNTNYGITLGTSANYNNVSNNNIYLNPQGIRVAQAGYNNITYNKIYNNDYGIYLYISEITNISHNNISSNNNDGIYIITDDTSDEIFNNTITWNSRSGINCSYESDPIVKSNDIENNTWYGVWSGGGSDPTIENNTISYNIQGIYCVEHSSPTITWNDIHNNTDAGVNCTSGSNPVIHYNNIEDNLKDLNDPESGYGVNNQYPSIEVDATYNWWGDDSGPYHSTNPTGQGNQVSNYVIFIPFSTYKF